MSFGCTRPIHYKLQPHILQVLHLGPHWVQDQEQTSNKMPSLRRGVFRESQGVTDHRPPQRARGKVRFSHDTHLHIWIDFKGKGRLTETRAASGVLNLAENTTQCCLSTPLEMSSLPGAGAALRSELTATKNGMETNLAEKFWTKDTWRSFRIVMPKDALTAEPSLRKKRGVTTWHATCATITFAGCVGSRWLKITTDSSPPASL